MSNNQFETDFQPQAPKQGRGCLFGCLIIGGLVLGSIVCAGGGLYWYVNKQIAKYTSETPLELPTVEYTADQIADLEQRMESFGNVVEASTDGQALPAGPAPTELVLTEEEINAMLCKDADMRGKIFVKIEQGQVSGDVSFPLDELPGGKGRYFNGSARFNVTMDDGMLIVTLAGAEVNGEAVPKEMMDAMANENLANEMYNDPQQRKMLQRFESIEVGDGQVTLKLKPVESTTGDENAGEDTREDTGVLELETPSSRTSKKK